MPFTNFRETKSKLAVTFIALACGACTSVPLPLTAQASAPKKPATTNTVAIEPTPNVLTPTTTLQPATVTPSVQAEFDQANAALKAGRLNEAERILRALTMSNPQLSGPHANLGLVLRANGKLPQAITELEQAILLGPARAPVLNLLGISYRESGAFDKARASYEQALVLEPNYANALLNLGILHDLYLGDSAQAQALFVRYLLLVPTDAVVTKWVAELKNRKPQNATLASKDKT